MELYQLSYFVEVARHKNFSRAAERISIAQPALSQQIKNLETELGTALFVRGRRQTQLTPAGEALLPRAEALLAQAESAKQAVAEVAQLRGGRLVVVTISSVSACWLPEVIRGFIAAHPGIELVLVEDSSERVAALVESGRAEVGFLQLPVSNELFDVRGLVTEPFVLLVAANHPLAGLKSVRLAKLAGEPFVFYKGRARDTALSACRAAGFEPRVACESGELETVRALVSAGLGVALVPQLATRSLPRGLTAVSVREPRVERQLGLVTRRGHPWSAAAKEFISAFLKVSR
ncbi:MAG TPA: LysR family transcriptional regulator [Roseimicrobium sp.]|nr:LysR family transcriptional regulator [Roseimicrobium sp.]